MNINGGLIVNWIGGGVGLGVRATSAKLQFANELGNKLMFWDGGAVDRYGFGMDGSTMAAFVPAGAKFALRQSGYNGPEVIRFEGNGTIVANGGVYAGTELGGGYLRARSCYWKESGKDYNQDNQYHSVSCDPGWYARGWRAYATDYFDGGAAVECCLP